MNKQLKTGEIALCIRQMDTFIIIKAGMCAQEFHEQNAKHAMYNIQFLCSRRCCFVNKKRIENCQRTEMCSEFSVRTI